jgi:hypothetical protein
MNPFTFSNCNSEFSDDALIAAVLYNFSIPFFEKVRKSYFSATG